MKSLCIPIFYSIPLFCSVSAQKDRISRNPLNINGNRMDKSDTELSRAILKAKTEDLWADSRFTQENHWGFDTTDWSPEEKHLINSYRNQQLSGIEEILIKTTTAQPLELDRNHQGLLKDVGDVNVGFGVGVGPYASVNTGVGVSLGGSGPAGGLNEALGYDIFPRQGERWVLDDYTGNKDNIVPDRWRQYWIAVSEGRAPPLPQFLPHKVVAGVNGNVGIGLPTRYL